MTEFRRQVLDDKVPLVDTNAGLWLDKYLKNNNDDAKKNLVYEVVEKIKLSQEYDKFYQNWEQTLKAHGAVTRKAKTLGRLAVNLGAEATLENSIALNRTYGVPHIPGSALKGLAANYARNSLAGWNKNTQAYKDIFGTQDSAGYVNFYDALIDPKSGLGLNPDVVTVHHQDYYQKENVPPADWDSPIPIHFLTASGTFLIALSGPTPRLVDTAYQILGLALLNEGIGAKTSSGYGRMSFISTEIAASPVIAKKSEPVEVPAGYERGTVKNFDDAKGYGFIQPLKSGPDLFVHISDLGQGLRELKPRQKVIFKRGPGRKPGSEKAFDIQIEA